MQLSYRFQSLFFILEYTTSIHQCYCECYWNELNWRSEMRHYLCSINWEANINRLSICWELWGSYLDRCEIIVICNQTITGQQQRSLTPSLERSERESVICNVLFVLCVLYDIQTLIFLLWRVVEVMNMNWVHLLILALLCWIFVYFILKFLNRLSKRSEKSYY